MLTHTAFLVSSSPPSRPKTTKIEQVGQWALEELLLLGAESVQHTAADVQDAEPVSPLGREQRGRVHIPRSRVRGGDRRR